MRTILLTSDSLRHKYIAHCLAAQLNLALIITEKKSPKITATDPYGKEGAEFFRQHFLAREKSEEKYFGAHQEFPSSSTLLQVNHGESNSAQVAAAIEKVKVQYIVLFGSSIIEEPLLKKYPGHIINLHLGLSPYYRGSATNLFPYYYAEPECVGGTIHLASSEVDKGAILHQFRPQLDRCDSLHDIGNKVILKGGKVLPQILKRYDAGNITPKQQKGDGRICRNKDLNPQVLREIYEKFEVGLIEEYLEEKKKRDEAKPIITNYTN